ncbi:lamin tail domain-containing protein [Patescibacteria group bacterium]|nr:lamin tail domain-containing protein [Patescibacteria group bacterium]MBU1501132.1 lamin tail domain-containing protein [Patescibacteria group bacterium]MBU2080995.1 lamin tail domain-containing protein [Patescibacteria group bacterium]MBU2124087.1 lamin tail domain-containing protein [Patescibacteria group bacterium]MBU2194942.1 lamin tail domain-containing protein [Patescibacteria group bacterium]
MSRYLLLLVLLGTGLLAPRYTHAAVLISEIAWMGTSVDNGSFCEWVELQNTGEEEVSLSGWKLKTDDGGMSVPLSGRIGPGAYYLIVRATPSACPDPVPSVEEDLKYTFGGGLSNAGEKLVLSSPEGSVETIDASSGWEKVVGGDSTRKLTAQRTLEGWVTAVATPRAANATESVVTESTSSTSGSSTSTKKAPANPVPTFYIEAGGDRVVSTRAHVSYVPVIYDSEGRLVRSAYTTWAFGDGSKHTGAKALHAYRESGEYLVVIRAQQGYSSGLTSFVVTADTADIEISALSEKGVSLTSKDTRILDLSQYQLVSGEESFLIPNDTQILPGRTVIFPPEVTGLATTSLEMTLQYPSGEVLHEYRTQPLPEDVSTIYMKEIALPETTEIKYEEHEVEAPAQAVRSVGAGALSFQRLIRSFWPDWTPYRTLSRLYP